MDKREITENIIESYWYCLNYEKDIKPNQYICQESIDHARTYITLQIQFFNEIYGKEELFDIIRKQYGEEKLQDAISAIKNFVSQEERREKAIIPRYQYARYFEIL